MRKRKSMFGLFLLVAVVLLGIGYAQLENIDLTIGGSASADADTSNFKVAFEDVATDTEIPTANVHKANENASNTISGTVEASGDHAEIVVEGLSTTGDYATYTFTIKNNSDELKATINELSANITGDNASFFNVELLDAAGTDDFSSTQLAAGGEVEVTVKVSLVKTPTETVSGTVDVKLEAVPSSAN